MNPNVKNVDFKNLLQDRYNCLESLSINALPSINLSINISLTIFHRENLLLPFNT